MPYDDALLAKLASRVKFTPPVRPGRSPAATYLAGSVVSSVCGYLLWQKHGGFLTGEWTYIWDSFHVLHVFHMFFDQILNQGIPLWAPELNGENPCG